MRVVFGSSFDSGAWPGPLGDAEAALDDAWVGPLGFLKILETGLGLGGLHSDVTRAERAASLVPALRTREGAWSRSLDADPLAVARTVLRLRDALVDAGLDPALDDADALRLPPRLRDVVGVCRGVVAGPGDRLAAVVRELGARACAIDDVALCDPEDALSPAWRRVVAALRARGTRIAPAALEEGPGGALDLHRARRAPFHPQSDGSLQLLRADCPEEAAAEVAAHVASLPEGEPVLVVGGDALLDVGLARLGLPTLGARGERGDDGLLQVAPLVVALAWPERDPERAFELLTLPASPLRKRIAGSLARALAREPAVDGDAWRQALERRLATLPQAEAAKARARVAALFSAPSADAATMPLAVLEERLTFVNRWLQRRMESDADGDRVLGAIAQVASIRRIARAFGAPALSRTELMRVVEQATAGVRPMRARKASAGLAQVRDPGAVAGPCAHVVWWSFTAAAEPALRTPSVTRAERAALLEMGVALPEPGRAAEQRAAQFQRPLTSASSTLVLCCPRRDRKGDAGHPHPLWDEVVARAAGAEAVRALEVGTLAPRGMAKKGFKGRDVATPQAAWRFPAGSVQRPVEETATKAESLLGCSFRAVLERAGLKARARRLPSGGKLFGDLAHDVLARVLAERPATAALAGERARAIFDERVPRRAAVLLRPVEATQRTRARDLVARASEHLVELLLERGFTVRDVELDIKKGVEGRAMLGRLDLVVQRGDALVVVDHKSGSERRRLRELLQGTAVQLAVYASLLREPSSPWPGVGYYQIRSRRLLTTDEALGGEQAVDPGSHDVAWTADRIKRKAHDVEADIAAGRCDAPGVGKRLYELRSQAFDDDLLIAPPCRHCRFSLLCGRALPGGENLTGRAPAAAGAAPASGGTGSSPAAPPVQSAPQSTSSRGAR